MELLSPAGNREALVAAIACGADAVYLGYTAFGARSYAGNFDADGLRDAVAYAHERGKKIYVTVNTLVKQCELDDLRDVLDLLSDVRVDAVLVQDKGVVRIIQQSYPHLVLHASTQMTINNAQGARLMKDMGFARVVPARECTLDELRKMADVGVEVEAFAHGALCVADSVSFSVQPGEWLMIAGPNGAGKSTVLNAVAQAAPYTGQVLLNGRDARRMGETRVWP